MKSLAHSPTPWRADIRSTGLPTVIDANGDRVCEVEKVEALRGETCDDRARFIVRAVNNHDALVAMLERMIDYEDGSSPPDTFGGELFAEAAVLLAKVKS